jgi:hypothetical protein
MARDQTLCPTPRHNPTIVGVATSVGFSSENGCGDE